MKLKKEKRKGILLISLGILLVTGIFMKLTLEYRFEQKLLMNLTRQVHSVGTSKEASTELLPNVEETNSNPHKNTQSDQQELGIISIPKIKLEAPIQEGIDKKTLQVSIGHVPETAIFGDTSGNCVLAGHRNYTFGRFFNRLDELEIEDLIFITGKDGVAHYYEVTKKVVVNPEEVWVLEESEEPMLTLITCTPLYIATHRLVIQAKMISEME